MVTTEAKDGKREPARNTDIAPCTFDGLQATVRPLTGGEPIPQTIIALMSLDKYTWTRKRKPEEEDIKPYESNLDREFRGELIEEGNLHVVTIQITSPQPGIVLNANGQRIGERYSRVTITGLDNKENVICAAFNSLTNRWAQTTILSDQHLGLVF